MSMLTAQQLLTAAQRMKDNNKVSRTDARKVEDIATRMAKGQADGRELAWAKRQASGFLDRPPVR